MNVSTDYTSLKVLMGHLSAEQLSLTRAKTRVWFVGFHQKWWCTPMWHCCWGDRCCLFHLGSVMAVTEVYQ